MAGIIEEMIDDTLGELDNSEDIEDAAEEEVEKVLFELTAGKSLDNQVSLHSLMKFHLHCSELHENKYCFCAITASKIINVRCALQVN